jgi:hypothetical protein
LSSAIRALRSIAASISSRVMDDPGTDWGASDIGVLLIAFRPRAGSIELARQDSDVEQERAHQVVFAIGVGFPESASLGRQSFPRQWDRVTQRVLRLAKALPGLFAGLPKLSISGAPLRRLSASLPLAQRFLVFLLGKGALVFVGPNFFLRQQLAGLTVKENLVIFCPIHIERRSRMKRDVALFGLWIPFPPLPQPLEFIRRRWKPRSSPDRPSRNCSARAMIGSGVSATGAAGNAAGAGATSAAVVTKPARPAVALVRNGRREGKPMAFAESSFDIGYLRLVGGAGLARAVVRIEGKPRRSGRDGERPVRGANADHGRNDRNLKASGCRAEEFADGLGIEPASDLFSRRDVEGVAGDVSQSAGFEFVLEDLEFGLSGFRD